MHTLGVSVNVIEMCKIVASDFDALCTSFTRIRFRRKAEATMAGRRNSLVSTTLKN